MDVQEDWIRRSCVPDGAFCRSQPSGAVSVQLQRRAVTSGAGITPGEYLAVDWSPLLLFDNTLERAAKHNRGQGDCQSG